LQVGGREVVAVCLSRDTQFELLQACLSITGIWCFSRSPKGVGTGYAN